MKGKKYHKSTETVRDQAKKDLVSHHVRRLFKNYLEPCHKVTSEPERLLYLPYQCIESAVCPLTDTVFLTQCETSKGRVFINAYHVAFARAANHIDIILWLAHILLYF